MKNTILLFSLMISLSLIGQEKKLVENGQYYFVRTLTPESSKTKFTDSIGVDIKKKHLIQIVSVDEKKVTFKYLKFENSEIRKLYNGDTADKTFSMPIENFTFYTRPYLNLWRKWKVGTYSVPIRLRADDENFEFDSNLSLGTNVIKGINFSRYKDHGYVDLSVGIGLTKVNLTTDNSDLASVQPELDKLSESALTVSLGATIHLAKNVNFGIFYGWDYLDGAEQKELKWIYNAKPWYGFGINVGLTANGSENTSNKKDQ